MVSIVYNRIKRRNGGVNVDVRISYSVYKSYYAEYPADDYDPKKKTINVKLPDYKRVRLPKEWGAGPVKYINHVKVQIYSSGYSESYLIEQTVAPYRRMKIYPGLKARERVID